MDGQIRCPRCWRRLPGYARFCSRCGSTLSASSLISRARPTGGSCAGGKAHSGWGSFRWLLVTFFIGSFLLKPIIHGCTSSDRDWPAAEPTATESTNSGTPDDRDIVRPPSEYYPVRPQVTRPYPDQPYDHNQYHHRYPY